MAKEQLFECCGDRIPLLAIEGFEEGLVGADQCMKRLPGELAALGCETDQHAPPIFRIRRSAGPGGSSCRAS
jgi:hypothetical protein